MSFAALSKKQQINKHTYNKERWHETKKLAELKAAGTNKGVPLHFGLSDISSSHKNAAF